MGLAMHSTLSPHSADIQIWPHLHENDQSNGPFQIHESIVYSKLFFKVLKFLDGTLFV